MRHLSFHNFRLLLVFALFGALASASFSHRIHTQPLTPELQAYMLAGGSLSDICGDVENGSEHAISQTCEFCLLVSSSALLGAETQCLANSLSFQAQPKVFDQFEIHPFKLDQSRTARGPPAA